MTGAYTYCRVNGYHVFHDPLNVITLTSKTDASDPCRQIVAQRHLTLCETIPLTNRTARAGPLREYSLHRACARARVCLRANNGHVLGR